MKYGISSYVFVSPFSNETLDQLGYAKKLGFDIYEIGVENPELIDVDFLKRKAASVGIEVYICGAFGESRDISSDKEEYRENGINYVKELIDIAQKVGSPYVSGPMYSATGKARLLSEDQREKQKQYALKNLRNIAKYADEKGVKLAIEPLNRFETDFMNTVEQGIDFLEELGADNVGFLLDTFHMNIEEKDIPKAIRKAGNKVFSFHACANDRGTPGEDHFDWVNIKQALKDIDYMGPLIIESFTTDIKEIAKAVSLWRPLAESQEALSSNGLRFLKKLMEENKNEEKHD